MKVIKIAQVPPPTVPATATVLDAVRTMETSRGGATAVVDGSHLLGIFSERDLMLRVVAAGHDPSKTIVSKVMTSHVETLTVEATTSEALELMVSRHFRHVPVVDERGNLVGLLSLRSLLQHHVDELVDQLHSLSMYMAADGPGG